ncbi:hypothetical protein [Bacillus wiedmannii]
MAHGSADLKREMVPTVSHGISTRAYRFNTNHGETSIRLAP